MNSETKSSDVQQCGAEGCTKPVAHVGLCSVHYQEKWRRDHGIRARRDIAERDELGRKLCAQCGEWKPEPDFSRSAEKKDGLDTACRVCTKDKYKRKKARRKEFLAMLLANQDGLCAICLTPLGEGGARAVVDHDHDCCRNSYYCDLCVRGALCYGCNSGLGLFGDDPLLLLRAFRYLDVPAHTTGRVVTKWSGSGLDLSYSPN